MPVYPDAPDKMLTKAEAVKLLDELSMDWRRHGMPPAYVVGGEPLYAESDLIEWLLPPAAPVYRDPKTGDVAHEL
jgi:hypothetical protein